ncbi:MAG: carbonic anhydrase [Minisyncoccia bacterium]
MVENKKMGLALVCSDGRLHQGRVQYNKQLCDALGVDLVDIVALPGPDGLFKAGREVERDVALAQAKLLIDAHHPTAVAVVGHYTCAGNPTSDEEHDADAKAAAEKCKTALGFENVLSFSTVRHSDEEWSLKKIS